MNMKPRKYRKKPVIVEAMRWRPSMMVWGEMHEFCPLVRMGEPGSNILIVPVTPPYDETWVSEGDYVVKYPDGSFNSYPAKEFEEDYEPAD